MERDTNAEPDFIPTLDALRSADSFQYRGEDCRLICYRRSSTLLVTFDDHSMVDTGYPRGPWLGKYAEELNYSILGIQADTKTWFRISNAGALIERLVSAGYFEDFDRIIVTGTSMGGFGALVFGPLIPRAQVLAFGPQTTLNADLVPEETRYPAAQSLLDWETPPYHDAAARISALESAIVVYDPHLSEDRMHAKRLIAPNVIHYKLPFFGHSCVRMLAKHGALTELIEDVATRGRITRRVFEKLRERRQFRIWNRRLIQKLEADGRTALRERAARFMYAARPDYAFATPTQPAPGTPMLAGPHVPIVGVMRFSFFGPTDTKQKHDHDTALNELYDPGRMEARFHYFEKLMLPSLKAQTDGDYQLKIVSSKVMPEQYQQRLHDLVADMPQTEVILAETQQINPVLHPVIQKACQDSKADKAISFRIDDDDALSQHYIERLRYFGTGQQPTTIITFPRVIALFLEEDRTIGASAHTSISHGIGVARMNSSTHLNHPFQMSHQRIWRRLPTLMDPTFMSALRTLHHHNDSAVKRSENIAGFKSMGGNYGTPEHKKLVEDALKENFPNQTLKSLEQILQAIT